MAAQANPHHSSLASVDMNMNMNMDTDRDRDVDMEVAHTHGYSGFPRRPAPAVLPQHDDEKAASVCPSAEDPEKQAMSTSPTPSGRREMAERHNPYFAGLPYDRSTINSVDDDHLVDQRVHLESKALKILLFLSGPCVLLSGLLCVWSIIATFAIVFTYPFRYFSSSRTPLTEEILSTLARSNRLQLRAIFSFASKEGRDIQSLLLVHLLSPFLAIGLALAAWAVAIYWLFAAMIGDPDGSEGGDDGRATVLGLRAYWELWLCSAMAQ